MSKEKRCLKFEGYLYMPTDTDNYKVLRAYASRNMGVIKVFDENNNNKDGKSPAFNNLGQMLDIIMTEYRKRLLKRVSSKKIIKNN